MTQKQINSLLNMLRSHGVNHFKTPEMEVHFAAPHSAMVAPVIDFKPIAPPVGAATAQPSAAGGALPKDSTIPHHINEVRSMMKMGPEELVNTIFPIPEVDENAPLFQGAVTDAEN